MSKCRIVARVRKNVDYQVVTAELDRLGIAWELCPPKSTGHPYILVAGRVRRTIASSPGPRVNPAGVLADLRRWLVDNKVLSTLPVVSDMTGDTPRKPRKE